MSKKQIVLHADMGSDILKRLSEFTKLPEVGYVAGQSVASAVSELFGDGRAVVYNDVDVFRQQTPAEFNAVMERIHSGETEFKRKTLKTCEFSTTSFVQGYRFLGISSESRYRVLHTSRDGMLNEVQCWFNSHDAYQFLETFDMNCVQVGVNLETRKLFWTPKFDNFCQTRQIEIAKLHTPAHTLIRYLKKREELQGIYGNDTRMLEMVAAACDYRDPTEKGNKAYNMAFGEPFREKLRHVEHLVTPYFDIKDMDIDGYKVYYLKPRHQVDSRLQVKSDLEMIHMLPVKSHALQEKHTAAKASRYQYLAETADETSFTRASWIRSGSLYVQGNVTPAQMRQMDKLIEEHHIGPWLKADTLIEQWNRFDFIREQARTRGIWVYGVLERSRHENMDLAQLPAFLDEQEKQLAKTLKKKALPDLTIKGFQMRELVTGMQLVEEGAQLHHCVAGYAESVAEGRSRIISARPIGSMHSKDWVTIEIVKHYDAQWTLAQVRGVTNRQATELEYEVAKQYVHYTATLEKLPKHLGKALVMFTPKVANVLGREFIEMGTKYKVLSVRHWSHVLSRKLKLPYNISNPETNGTYNASHVFNYWTLMYKTRAERAQQERDRAAARAELERARVARNAELEAQRGGAKFADLTEEIPF